MSGQFSAIDENSPAPKPVDVRQAVRSQVGGERIEVVVYDPSTLGQARELLAASAAGAVEVDDHTRRLTAPSSGGSAGLVRVIRDIDATGIAIDDIGLRRPTLDDVFLSLTGHTVTEEEADEEQSTEPAGRTS